MAKTKYEASRLYPSTIRKRIVNKKPLNKDQQLRLLTMEDCYIRQYIGYAHFCDEAEDVLYKSGKEALLNYYVQKYELHYKRLCRCMTEKPALFMHHCNHHMLPKCLQNSLLSMTATFALPFIDVQNKNHFLYPDVKQAAQNLGWIN